MYFYISALLDRVLLEGRRISWSLSWALCVQVYSKFWLNELLLDMDLPLQWKWAADVVGSAYPWLCG